MSTYLESIGKTKAYQAFIEFDNGFGISILIGGIFYSDGVSTYEVAVTKNRKITYNTEITSDVMGHLTRDEVTDVMVKVQNLSEDHFVDND